MAVVPYKGTSDLNATQNPTPYQNIPTDEDMFGAAIGRGLQNLSKSLGQFGDTMADNALKIQSRVNEAHSEELFNGATIELGKLDAEYGQLSGKARYDGYQDYVNKAQAIRQKFLDAAGNPEAARLFDRQFSRRLTYGIVNEGGKAATALQQYENDAKSNKLKLLTEQAGASADEKALDLNLQQIDETVDQTKDLPSNKWSPEHTEVVRGQLRDQAMMNFLQNLTLSNPMRAQKILEDRKDKFQDPKNYNAIKAKVDQGMLRAGTRQDADEIWKAVGPRSDAGGNSYAATTFRIESGGNPNAQTGSNRGLGQFGPAEEAKFGINDSNRNDPQAQAAALAKETAQNAPKLQAVLGRPPTDAELYIAHQQGVAGGPALLANPNKTAWEAIRPFYGSDAVAKRAITGNIPSDSPLKGVPVDQITAGQFTDMWKAKYDHFAGKVQLASADTDSPMAGVQIAENVDPKVKNDYVSPDTLGNALAKVDDYAAKRYPNDPGMQAMYRDELITRLKTNYATDRAVLKEQRQQRQTIVFSELIAQPGQKGPTQLEQLSPNAYLAYQDMDPVQQRAVAKQLEANAKADVPLSPERFSRYQQVMGLSVSNPDQFMDIAPGELDLPRTLQAQIFNKQRSIQKGLDQSKINNALRTVQPLLNDAGIFASKTNTNANDNYNKFVGAFDAKLDEYRSENKKEPTPEDQRKIASGLIQDVAGSGWFGTGIGGRKAFEVPSTWGKDGGGNAVTTDRIVNDFKARNNRPPTPRELYQMYERFNSGAQ